MCFLIVRILRNAAASGLPDVIPYLYRTIPANYRLQLLSAPLEESDPAIYDILQKVELANSSSAIGISTHPRNRRKNVSNISSTSSPPRTSHHKLSSMRWAVSCKVSHDPSFDPGRRRS